MPTKREREYYRMGFKDGVNSASEEAIYRPRGAGLPYEIVTDDPLSRQERRGTIFRPSPKRKRKLSAWNKFVKANSKKPRFIMRSGKLNLKKMGVAFRRQKKR